MPLDDIKQIMATLDCLYGAALNPLLWPDALDRVSELTGGLGTVAMSISSRTAAVISSPSLQDALLDYEKNEWWRHDVLRERGGQLGPVHGLYTDRDVVSQDTMNRHPFFQDFWRKHRIDGMASFATTLGPGRIVTIAVQREASSGDFKDEELAALKMIGPHFASALTLASKLSQAEARARDLETLLARFDIPALVVDRSGRVRASNDGARALIGDAITVSHDRLRAKAPSCQGVFDAALAMAFEMSLDGPKRWMLQRPAGGPPLLVQVFCAPQRVEFSVFDLALDDIAFVTFTELTAPVSGCPASALQALGLTSAEARVATSLGTGATTAETAERYGITVGTLRIHLKNIFCKLDLRGQSDLTRLVARLTVLK